MHDAYINGNHAQHDTITHTPHEATRAHYTRGAELTIRLQTRPSKVALDVRKVSTRLWDIIGPTQFIHVASGRYTYYRRSV